jgi:hypothetical protein
MPLGKLVFKLPEESHEHEVAVQAMALYCAIQDLDVFLRNQVKYEEKTQISLQGMRDKLREILLDNSCEGLFL